MKKCPVCKSSSITPYMGAQFGKYLCKRCGYIGNIVLEDKDKKLDQKSREILRDMKKHLKKKQ